MYFHIFSTRFECGFTSSPPVSSVVSHLLHSSRVWFHIFPTRFECGFTSSPLVLSVVLPQAGGSESDPLISPMYLENLAVIFDVDMSEEGTFFTLETSVVSNLPHPKRV